MTRNHQFFVGGYDPDGDLASFSRDFWTTTIVGCVVYFDTEPRTSLTNSFSYLRGVFSNTGRKHDPVNAAQNCGKSTDLLGRAINEVIHRQTCLGFTSAQQIAHVVADTRYSDQTRFLVEQSLNFFCGEFETLKQMKDHARIERSGPSAHAQTVERRKSQRTVYALPIF